MVPEIAKRARPWAKVQVIGPPVGVDPNDIGFVEAQIDNDQFGKMFRLFVVLEEGDLEAIKQGNPIEIGLLCNQMPPVSVAVWKTPTQGEV